MERADHGRILSVGHGYGDPVVEHGGILRVRNAKNLATACVDFKRAKGRGLQQAADLLKHGGTITRTRHRRKAGASDFLSQTKMIAVAERFFDLDGLSEADAPKAAGLPAVPVSSSPR